MTDVNFSVSGARGPEGPEGPTGAPGVDSVFYTGQYATLPVPVSDGQVAVVTDIGIAGSIWLSSGANWILAAPIVLFEGNTPITHTGNITLIQIYNIALIAGLLANGASLEFEIFGTITGSGNSKEIEVVINEPVGGTNFKVLDIVTTTAGDTTFQAHGFVVGRDVNHILGRSWSLGYAGSWNYNSANLISNLNLILALNLIVKTQAGSGADTITVDIFKVILKP